MVTAASAHGSAKLQGNDFIFIAIFGLLLFIVFFVFAMVLGMNANTFWFTHAIGAIPGGIVWMYLAARVPKPGATAIMSIIVAIVGLLLGMLWTGPAGIVVGGALDSEGEALVIYRLAQELVIDGASYGEYFLYSNPFTVTVTAA